MQVNYNAAIINLGIVCVRACVRGCVYMSVYESEREREGERDLNQGYNFSSALRILALPKDNILHKH